MPWNVEDQSFLFYLGRNIIEIYAKTLIPLYLLCIYFQSLIIYPSLCKNIHIKLRLCLCPTDRMYKILY